jgi:hypothetical protein
LKRLKGAVSYSKKNLLKLLLCWQYTYKEVNAYCPNTLSAVAHRSPQPGLFLAPNGFSWLASVVIALMIGTVELLQVVVQVTHLHGALFEFVAGLNFGLLGYLIAAMFLFAWALSVVIWKVGRLDERYGISGGASDGCECCHRDGETVQDRH